MPSRPLVLTGFLFAAAFLLFIPLYFAWPALTASAWLLRPIAPDPTTICGDGKLETGELCDDGNQFVGDGCSACLVERGYVCSGEPSMCIPSRHGCGNGIIEKGEQCDDGNNADGDGCSAHCARENGFECRGASHSFCHPAGYWN